METSTNADMGSGTRNRVLLVEDDEQIRELLDDVLLDNGFAVSSYRSAEDALGHSAPFDLLLTDMRLPGLNGRALVREIKRRDPAMPVLMMSADASPDDVRELSLGGFLRKPFSCWRLVAQVQQLLSA